MSEDQLYERLKHLRKRLAPEKHSDDREPRAREHHDIMVVDDDDDNLTALERRLSKRYRTTCCGSGDQAVREFIASDTRFFGVVMDIRMPGMSGLRAAKLIRNDDPYVPLIFRTGFSDEYPEDDVLGMYEGTVDYVTKGQRGHDYYLDHAIARGIKSYDALLRLHQACEQLRQYDLRLQTVVEQLIAHEKNLQTAVDFQTGLLGKPEDRPGLSLAAFHRFCDQMGGDFYDIIDAGQGKTGVLIADVSGHGIPAALVTGMLKSQIEVSKVAADPAQFLRELNASIFNMLAQREKFVTAAYVVLHPKAGSALYVNAGHSPGILVRATGAVEECGAPGLPIGMAEDLELDVTELDLKSGDSLWLYSDGVFESPNAAGERLGRERFLDMILQSCRDDHKEWAHTAFVECERFVGNQPIADDMTVVSVMHTQGRGRVA